MISNELINSKEYSMDQWVKEMNGTHWSMEIFIWSVISPMNWSHFKGIFHRIVPVKEMNGTILRNIHLKCDQSNELITLQRNIPWTSEWKKWMELTGPWNIHLKCDQSNELITLQRNISYDSSSDFFTDFHETILRVDQFIWECDSPMNIS